MSIAMPAGMQINTGINAQYAAVLSFEALAFVVDVHRTLSTRSMSTPTFQASPCQKILEEHKKQLDWYERLKTQRQLLTDSGSILTLYSRPWALNDDYVLVDRQKVSAGLLDCALFIFHRARITVWRQEVLLHIFVPSSDFPWQDITLLVHQKLGVGLDVIQWRFYET